MLFMIIGVIRAKEHNPWGWYFVGFTLSFLSMLGTTKQAGIDKTGGYWFLFILESAIWATIMYIRHRNGEKHEIKLDEGIHIPSGEGIHF